MKLPTDPISLIVYFIDLGIITLDAEAAYTRLASGITATATKENREITDDEAATIKAAEAAADKARNGI